MERLIVWFSEKRGPIQLSSRKNGDWGKRKRGIAERDWKHAHGTSGM